MPLKNGSANVPLPDGEPLRSMVYCVPALSVTAYQSMSSPSSMPPVTELPTLMRPAPDGLSRWSSATSA